MQSFTATLALGQMTFQRFRRAVGNLPEHELFQVFHRGTGAHFVLRLFVMRKGPAPVWRPETHDGACRPEWHPPTIARPPGSVRGIRRWLHHPFGAGPAPLQPSGSSTR